MPPAKKANKVKRLRESLGLTREQFAKRLAVSHRTVEGWELGVSVGKTATRLMATLKK